MGKSMKTANFFTNVAQMVSCNTPEFFNARLEGQHAQNLVGVVDCGKISNFAQERSKVTNKDTKI